MKKLPLLVSFILLITFFTYFSDANDIYASIALPGISLPSSSYVNQTLNNFKNDKPRDFKIPDNNESENYNSQDKNNDNVNNPKSINSTPWQGPKLVVIDPGHGGTDPGASSGDLLEKNINLDISLRVNKLLEAAGVDTYITRTTDETVDLKERIYTANKLHAALFISIHSNWYSDTSLSGTMTLYNPSDKLSAGYLSEMEFAQTLQTALIKALGTTDRGIIDRPKLAVLGHAEMPSLIVELAFLSNVNDAELLSSESFKQKAAEAIAEGIRTSLDKISDNK